MFLLLVMICGLLGSCSAGVTADQDVHQDFLEGNRAYEAGEWSKAIRIYESLAVHSGFSASLCYNLANSYARNGQTGKAVLGYERALYLVPGDVDSRSNLQRLRQDKGLLPEEIPLVQRVGSLLGLNQWAVLAAIVVVVLALLHLATLRFTFSGRLLYALTAVCLLLLGVCSAGILIQYHHWQRAVIIAPETSLLISPFDGAQTTGVIEEGCLVRMINNHGTYTLIKDEKGHSGWIPRSSLELIAMKKVAKPL